MTASLEGVSGQQHAPAALYNRERPVTHFTGGWVGPRAGLDGRENLVHTGIRSRTFHPVVSHYTDLATRTNQGVSKCVNTDCNEETVILKSVNF